MSEYEEHDFVIKLMIVGDMGVGKTSILRSYFKESFMGTNISTIGLEYRVTSTVYHNKKLKIQFWDTSGQERFKQLTKIYYKNSHGVILVYDVSDFRSIENVQRWIEEIKKEFDNDIPIIAFGNKIDLCHENTELPEWPELSIYQYYVSAKDNESISGPINFLLKRIATKMIEEQEGGSGSTSFTLFPIVAPPPKKECCH